MTKSDTLKGHSSNMAEKETKDFPPCPLDGYRPRCFFDIQINKVDAGRLVFELFNDICPKTCENFRALCTGEKGEGKTTSKPLHYKNTILHRIVKNFIIQGGDFVSGDGTGGESIYGGTFKDENFKLQHDRPFLLSMANCGANTNGSQFFITLAASHHLDNVHTVFGHILFGQDIVRDMENQKVNSNHKPYADIRISHCGELIKKAKTAKSVAKPKEVAKKSDSSSLSESDSDSNHRKKRPKKVKKSKDENPSKGKAKSKEQHPNSRDTNTKEHPNAKEPAKEPADGDLNFIPTVPSTFLMRRSRTPSPVRERRRQEGLNTPRRREPVLRTRINMVSRSGKKLRGRGVMRYRTPTPETTDSEDDINQEVPPEGDNNASPNKLEKLGKKVDDKEHLGYERKSWNIQNHRNYDLKSESFSQSKPNDKIHNRRRSRSRSKSIDKNRNRRRSRSLSKSIDKNHNRRRSRSMSESRRRPIRFQRRSPSYERRRPRYRRSRSRSRSPRKQSRSPVRYRQNRNSSCDRKGKFERHHSESGSDSSQERKLKSTKGEEKKDETHLVNKPTINTIKEKIDKLFQKKQQEDKVLVTATKPVETNMVTEAVITDFSISQEDVPDLNNKLQYGEELSKPKTSYSDMQSGNNHDTHVTMNGITELQNSPPPTSPHKESSISANADELSPNLKAHMPKDGKPHSFPTGIDEKSSLVQSETYDDFIATSIEEENISGYFFDHPKDNSHMNRGEDNAQNAAVRDGNIAIIDSKNSSSNHSADRSNVFDTKNQNNDPLSVQLVDEIIINKSKEKIGELQEQIREFKEFHQLGERIDLPPLAADNYNDEIKGDDTLSVNKDKEDPKVVRNNKNKPEEKMEIISHMNESDDSEHKSHVNKIKINKLPIAPENGKVSDNSEDENVSKKKTKKRGERDPSSELSDEKVQKGRRRSEAKKSRKKLRKKHRSKHVSSSSSESDEGKEDSEDSENTTDTDDESAVEADRDRKRSKKSKHKLKKSTSERSHGNKGDNSIKHRKGHKKKKYYSDYSSESSEEDRKGRKKYHRKKQHISRDSSSDDSSGSAYENSNKKRRLKTYGKIKDRKRKKRKSIST